MNIKEEDIRPKKIFDEYLKLTLKDTITYFENVKKEDINCPACENVGSFWVKKQNFTYQKCSTCHTIFVSPRPYESAFNEYYKDSPSTKFWATTFYKVTESSRREKLWKPKARMIKERIIKFQKNKPFDFIIDIGGGYGVFDEEIKKIMDIKTIVVEPSIHLAKVCRKKNLTVIEKFIENISKNDLPKGRKCFVSFELFEHLHNPKSFLDIVYKNMQSGDFFIFTTLSGMGIDIQLLGDKSNSLSPPHHLNFFNPKSVSNLLRNCGFKVLEAITPGKLDMDILKTNLNLIKDTFWKNVLSYCNEKEIEEIQNFIAKQGLSSHMMISCFKP